MRKLVLTLGTACLVAMLTWGCGSNRESDGTIAGQGTTLADAQTLGITNCLTCHNSDTAVTSEWLNSRHGNNLIADAKQDLNSQGAGSAGDNPAHDDDNEGSLAQGRPNYNNEDTCFTCHDKLGDGRLIDAAIVTENERPITSCESCHGGGQFHNGISSGIPFPTPGPDQCGECHGVTEALSHSSDGDGANVRLNITDTHDDDETTAGIVEGYVVKTGEQTGCVDCHYAAHDFSLKISNQWAESAHAGHLKTLKDTKLATQRAALGADPTSEERAAVLTAVKAVGTDAESFTHDSADNGWDNIDDIDCQRCHTTTGGMNFLNNPTAYGAALAAFEASENSADAPNDYSYLSGWTAETGSPETELIYCWTCHSDSKATLRAPGTIPFPSGAELSLDDGSNICMACHQGRASGVTLKENLESGDFGFVNRHYLAAASIMFGKEATPGFQYRDDAEYEGLNTFSGHGGTLNTCTSCHMRQGADNHLMEPDITVCDDCHSGITDFNELGLTSGDDVDYDGDGTGESFQAEIDGVNAALLTALQDYADTLNAPIIYSAGNYPYFFNDTDGDRIVDPGENSFSNRYDSFDDSLLQAAYNYHSNQDPCSDNHNYKYVIQTAYDSLDDLDDGLQNNSVAGGIVRP